MILKPYFVHFLIPQEYIVRPASFIVVTISNLMKRLLATLHADLNSVILLWTKYYYWPL